MKKQSQLYKVKKKKRKIKYKSVLVAVFFIVIVIILIYYVLSLPVKNIYIEGNEILKDQEIIEIANLSDYPSFFKYSVHKAKVKLEKNIYISEAKINRHFFNKISIKITENPPLFYDNIKNKTVFKDSRTKSGNVANIVLINNIDSSKIYDKLISKLGKLNKDTISRISEISYSPNDVDKERFYLSMTDGNYVYVKLGKLSALENYSKILEKLENRKGILYLDSGDYFEIKEG